MTCNLDALLLENETLRHQVRLLREELALLQSRGEWREPPRHRQDGRRHPAAEDPFARPPGRGERVRSWRSGPEVTTGAAPGITPQLVRQWGEALARHPRWRELRLGSRLEGDPAAGGSLEFGLQALLDDLRSRSHDPALELEEALDRRSPGLGSELRRALSGPASRTRAAVRACFALHGPRAADLLSRDPQAVVEELLAAIAQLEGQARQEYTARREREARQQAWGRQQDGRRPGSRSWGWNGTSGAGSEEDRSTQAAPDPRRAEALSILELSWGASRAAVTAAHRRLVKLHHPDMGGDAESFRRINDAYQLLIA